MLYSVYNRLLNFEFGCFDISLVGLINFLSFYGVESLVIVVATMFGAEVAKSVLNNKNAVYTIGSGGGRGGREGSMNLFVVTIAIGLNDVYFVKSLVLFLLTFTLRFVVITFFSIVAMLVLLAAVLFVRTVLGRIHIAPLESLRL